MAPDPVAAPARGSGQAAAIFLAGVTVAYGDRVALEDVSLGVGRGELVGVVGPNGAGKSTLFKTLLGLLTPRAGVIRVLGAPMEVARRRIAYVPQRGLVAWDFPVTAEEVVLMGSYRRVGWLRWPDATERLRARAALERVGLADRAGAQIGRLSGGQQQRVFLARALVQLGEAALGSAAAPAGTPGLMLLDEPLAGVDAPTTEAVGALLRRVVAAGNTVLLSTHDLAGAAATCDRLVLLNRVVAGDGPPSAVLTPEVLGRTYGGQLLTLAGASPRLAVLDDGAHHGGAAVLDDRQVGPGR